MVAKADEIAKSEYNAQDEVTALKNEFADLRKSLMAEKESIIKAQTEATALPDNFPTSLEAIAKMDWEDIGKMMNKLEGGY